MIRFQIPFLALVVCCATVDVTQPISNAPNLVAFLKNPRGCFTPCGVHVPAGDCEAIQRYEGRVVKRLAQADAGWTEESICAGLKGYELKVRLHDPAIDRGCSDLGWRHNYSEDGGTPPCVSGLTSPALYTITVATFDWLHSALAHEVAHVADESRPGHCPWKRAELKLALYELSGRIEDQEAGPSCSP